MIEQHFFYFLFGPLCQNPDSTRAHPGASASVQRTDLASPAVDTLKPQVGSVLRASWLVAAKVVPGDHYIDLLDVFDASDLKLVPAHDYAGTADDGAAVLKDVPASGKVAMNSALALPVVVPCAPEDMVDLGDATTVACVRMLDLLVSMFTKATTSTTSFMMNAWIVMAATAAAFDDSAKMIKGLDNASACTLVFLHISASVMTMVACSTC